MTAAAENPTQVSAGKVFWPSGVLYSKPVKIPLHISSLKIKSTCFKNFLQSSVVFLLIPLQLLT